MFKKLSLTLLVVSVLGSLVTPSLKAECLSCNRKGRTASLKKVLQTGTKSISLVEELVENQIAQ